MRTVMLLLCGALSAAEVTKELAVLDRERDPAHLEAAAISIASSQDANAMARLARHFAEREFLRRLDPPHGSEFSIVRLGRVFEVLAEHPSASVESLCLSLARSPDFMEVPARLNFLLNALSSIVPMSEPAANVFRATGRTGFVEVNGPLLARNSSPRALAVLGELLGDESIDIAQRVSMAHWSLLPTRADARVVTMCADLLAKGGVSHEVEAAVLGSLYDYRAREWFGVSIGQPQPPPWTAASAETRELLKSLGAAALTRPDLPVELRRAIHNTLSELRP